MAKPKPENRNHVPSLVLRALNFGRRMSWERTFSALKYPNYKLWFWSQMVSLFGSWMQGTALGFLIYELTRSPAYLGLVGFASGAAVWIFMPYAGVVSDRVSRRKILIITQSAMMAEAFILAALAFSKIVAPWQILVLALVMGTVNTFEAPARQAFVLEMVDRSDMTNAIALNSAMFNTATALGPAFAGVTYALFGPGWCFVINGLSFIAVLVALGLMKLKPPVPRLERNSFIREFKEGLRYTASHSVIRALILTVGVTTIFGFSFATLIPAWAVNVLHGDARTNGFLQSARGVGAVIGALLIAALGQSRWRGRVLAFGTFAFPASLLLFAAVRWLPMSLLALVGSGVALIFVFNLCNALVQTFAPEELRGRVMSIYSLVFFGLAPIGSLWIGHAAEAIGEPGAIIIGASASLVFAIATWLFLPRLRKLG